MKEILLRVDEEARKRDLLTPLPSFDSFVGVEVVRTKDLPKPLVQTFEVTITTPPGTGTFPVDARDVRTGARRLLDPTRTVDVKETTGRPLRPLTTT